MNRAFRRAYHEAQAALEQVLHEARLDRGRCLHVHDDGVVEVDEVVLVVAETVIASPP